MTVTKEILQHCIDNLDAGKYWLDGVEWRCRDTNCNLYWGEPLRLVDARTYRIKPRTITINGIEVPEPERQAPKYNTQYFIVNLRCRDGVETMNWYDDIVDNLLLSRGQVHLTRQAASQHAKAMLGFTEVEDK